MLTSSSMTSFALVLLMQLFPSSQPSECVRIDHESASNAWERAKSPDVRRYCDLLASSAAKLSSSSTGSLVTFAIALAEEAERLRPASENTAPLILKGRALARLGRDNEAREVFEKALQHNPSALDDPTAQLTWARVLARTGDIERSMATYQTLLPRSSSLSSDEKAAAWVESGILSMARGPSGLDRASHSLRQAVRESRDTTRQVAVLALALALDRAGRKEEAKVTLKMFHRTDPKALFADPRARSLLLGKIAEGDALVAMALQASGEGDSRESWRAFLEHGGATSPWAQHAKAHHAKDDASRAPLERKSEIVR